MSQGQGKHTPKKETGFQAIFATSLSISKGGKAGDYPYWHIDMNAGCGWNEKAECWGSPVVFLEETIRREREFMAVFCEHDTSAAHRLKRLIEEPWHSQLYPMTNDGDPVSLNHYGSADVFPDDNVKGLAEFEKLIRASEDPRYAVGSLLCDPNGFRKGFPVDAIRDFAAEFPRIDLILNFNISLFAKVQGCKENGNSGFDHWPTIPDLIPTFHRKHLMVSSPPGWGSGDRFAIFIGRNFDTGQRRFLNFFPLESQQGQEIIHLFRSIPPDQPFLPGIDP